MTAPRPPEDLLAGRFRLLERLGAGGMGEVWSAEHLASGDKVAVKLLRSDAAGDPAAAARFEVEARTLCRIRHDHVVRVIDFGRDPARGWFLATELLQGETLGAILARERRLDPVTAVGICAQILEGLSSVHAADVVHRDLKPENVVIQADGCVKILDFGIAKLVDAGHRVDLTIAGTVFGTPTYLSPEQALARSVDARSDLYSLGVILYRMLSGRLPFEAETPTALALRHATEPLPPLPPDAAPAALIAVIEQALAKMPDSRPPSAAAMRHAILASIEGLDEKPWTPTAPVPLPLTRPVGTSTPVPITGRSVSRTVLNVRFGQVTQQAPGRAAVTPQMAARDVIEAFDGRIVWLSEEGLLAELVSPTDTMQCAAAVLDRLAALSRTNGWTAEVRAAAAAGEVLRAGRSLFGEPVVQAELLAQAASPGEILFTHSVYLAMTRSEIPSEPWPGRDPGTGQKLYRMVQPQGAPRPELPFGGATLGRAVLPGGKRVAREAARIARVGMADGAELAWRAGKALPPVMMRATRTSAIAGVKGVRALTTGTTGLIRRSPLLFCVAAFAVAAGGAGLAMLPSAPAAGVEEALVQDKAAEAARLADAWLEDEPDNPEAKASKGRVLAAAGQLDEAQGYLRDALSADPELAHDDRVAAALVRLLDEKGADRTIVVDHRTAAVERALVEATKSVRYWERWNAVRTLEKIGLVDKIDWVGVYLLDLEHAGSCGTRVRAANKLGELRDRRAIKGLEAARDAKLEGSACNLRSAVAEALAAIRGEG